MTIQRLIYILGFVLIGYAVIGGFSMRWTFVEAGNSLETSYTFKIGILVLGIVFIYLGKDWKAREKEE